jgi:acetolactate synthase-1/2/3 large subunit
VLRTFAETARIPVACTLLGLGAFPGRHPLSLGFIGMHGAPWCNLAIQEADLIIALGMRFDDRVTGDPATFAAHARKIHVEVDRAEVNKIVPVDLPLVGDLREVLERLVPGLDAVPTGPWLERIGQLKGAHAGPAPEPWPPVAPGAGLSPIEVTRLLDRAAPDALWVTDVGQHQMWQAQVMRPEQPRDLVTSGGLGTMGFALPAAIGARLARPDKEVWVLAGDGALQMSARELMTLAQEGLKVDIAVINNGTLGMVRQLQTLFYQDRRRAVELANPDFQALAEAYGLRAMRAATLDEAEAAVAAARACPEPVLIEFLVDPEATVYPVVPPGGRLEAMLYEPGLA